MPIKLQNRTNTGVSCSDLMLRWNHSDFSFNNRSYQQQCRHVGILQLAYSVGKYFKLITLKPFYIHHLLHIHRRIWVSMHVAVL